jgi:hypothetical protein
LVAPALITCLQRDTERIENRLDQLGLLHRNREREREREGERERERERERKRDNNKIVRHTDM